MNFRDHYNFDVFLSMLSILDIGGVLYDTNSDSLSRGLEYDATRLLRDQNSLSKDYRKACDRLSKELVAPLAARLSEHDRR